MIVIHRFVVLDKLVIFFVCVCVVDALACRDQAKQFERCSVFLLQGLIQFYVFRRASQDMFLNTVHVLHRFQLGQKIGPLLTV